MQKSRVATILLESGFERRDFVIGETQGVVSITVLESAEGVKIEINDEYEADEMGRPVWRCPNGHEPNEFVAKLPSFDDTIDPNLGVLVYPDGTVTNRYDDGCAGVTEFHRELALAEEYVYCPMCWAEAVRVGESERVE